MKCNQPGCSGTIVDGYCDVCGMAAEPLVERRRASACLETSCDHGRTRVRRRHAAARSPAAPARSRRLLRHLRDGGGLDGATTRGAADEAQPLSGATSRSPPRRARCSRRRSARRGRRTRRSSTRRTRTGSQRMRAARLGAGLTRVPPAPPVDAAKAINPNPSVPEDKRTCSKCGTAIGRSRDGKPGRAGGVLPAVRPAVLVHAEAEAGRRRRRAVRSGRRPRARRPGLDLPRPRPQRLRPLGGAQGPAQLRRPRRAGRGDRRAAVPGAGRAPADRRDLQLRDPRRRRLHRDGVRRRQVAQADPQAADARQQRRLRPAAGRPGAGLHPRGAAGVPVPPRPRAASTATSSPTT